jgi:hypothetical protein
MTRLANRFTNPQDATFYDWEINHSEEGEAGVARTITRGGKSSGTGLVRQQADDQPMVFQFQGTIFKKSHLEEFIKWYVLCKSQTIFFKKYSGDEFEVIITEFKPVEKKTLRNPKDFANAPLWYWTYTMTIEVITVRSGVWQGIVT